MRRTEQNKVTTVIVTYQSRDTIDNTLRALYGDYCANLTEIIIVDNASTDGTENHILEKYPWVSLIRSKNIGFGRGCNVGFQNVTTPYVLFLNPDAVLEQGALQILIDFMAENQQVGIAAPAIIEGEDSLQDAGLMTTPVSLLKSTIGLDRAIPDKQPIIPNTQAFKTPWVCGAAMFIRSTVFREVKGFDERFFLYFEETDLCRRVASAGAEIWAVGNAVARHMGGASAKATGKELHSSCIAEHFYPSRFYYLVKHFGWLKATTSELIVRAIETLRQFRANYGKNSRHMQRQTVKPFISLRFPKLPEDVP